jgi:SAM-dependent methyltransferase
VFAPVRLFVFNALMQITRRRFVLTSLATPFVFSTVSGLRRPTPWANEKLRVAKVGCGGMGTNDLLEVAGHRMVEIAALCDIDRRQLDALRLGTKDDKGNAVAPRFPGVPAFADWREMFAKMGDRFDAVVVSTADHMHAPIAMAAMNMGKHVYCQKPLAHGAWENRRLAEVAAAKPKLVTQMGTQRIATKWRKWGGKLLRDGQGDPRVDQPPRRVVAAGKSAPRRERPDARVAVVGPVPRRQPVAPVEGRLHALQLAWHDRLGHRSVRRHGLPHAGRPVLRA